MSDERRTVKLSVLQSSSEGNSLLVWDDQMVIAVDAGVPVKEFNHRKRQVGCARPLDAILLTHGHGDHAAHAARVSNFWRCLVYASSGTAWNAGPMRALDHHRCVAFALGAEFPVPGGAVARSVPVPHSDGSTAYVLSKDCRSVGIFLDCGHITPAIAQAVDGLNVLAVESNYSQSMMAQSHYDEELKKRLMAGTGHLSNDDVAELLRHHRGTKLHTVVLLHLSRHTNLPALAEQAAALALNGRNVRVLVAQDIPITVEV